ncbi:MAG: hypothetical protein K6G78_03765 [bacterium]|nr:hypothetical protein [bacterium]
MASIRECAERFKDYYNRPISECAIIDKWIKLNDKSHPLDVEYSSMGKNARYKFKNDNRKFARMYFDERPKVVKLLKELLLFIGVSKEDVTDWLGFDNIYSGDEVCVLLLKYLQGERSRGTMTQQDIADYFGTSLRTIGSYISKMRPTRESLGKCRVFGQTVEMDPKRITNVPESTMHPIFLALDLVELRTLVNVLQDHIEGGMESIVVLDILDKIRSQVTDYAASRLPSPPGDVWIAHQRTHEEGARLSRGIIVSEKELLRARVTYEVIDEENGTESMKVCEGYISTDRSRPLMVNIHTENDEIHSVDYRRIIEFKNI